MFVMHIGSYLLCTFLLVWMCSCASSPVASSLIDVSNNKNVRLSNQKRKNQKINQKKPSLLSSSSSNLRGRQLSTVDGSYQFMQNQNQKSGSGKKHHVFEHAHAHSRNHSITKPGGVIVNLVSERKFFFLRNGRLRQVPDERTAEILVGSTLRENRENVSLSTMIYITQEAFDALLLDPNPVPSLALTVKDPDHYMAFYTDKIQTLQNPSVISRVVWMPLVIFQPAVLKFESNSLDILMASRGYEGALREIPVFRWLKKTRELGESCPNITDSLSLLNSGPNNNMLINKEQVRLVELPMDCPDCTYPPDKTDVAAIAGMSYAFPWRCDDHGISLYCAMVQQSHMIVYKNGSLETTKPHGMITIDKVGRGGVLQEKNWMPFVYNSTQYWIYKVWPLTIVAQNRNPSTPIDTVFEDTLTMDYVSVDSKCSGKKSPWEFGHMSGGTSAHLLPNGDNEYLGFFHSRFCPGGDFGAWCATCYWFGAFTMSATPPFKMTRITRYPIVHPPWYEGEWYAKATSYIVYPIGFYYKKNLGKSNSYEVVVSGSLNEKGGWLVHMELDDLLGSMEDVECDRYL